MTQSDSKARLDGLTASDLKLRNASIMPYTLTGARPNTANNARSSKVFGAAWSVAHSSMATPSNC